MTRQMIGVLLLALTAAGVGSGCGDGGASGGDKKSEGGDKTASSTDAIGVSDCDDYLKKAEACTSKQPAEGRASWEGSIKASREAWKKGVTGPQGKDAVLVSCKTALQNLDQNPLCK